MIETNNPEINVDEIMAKIRQEIASRHSESMVPGSAMNAIGFGKSDSKLASILIAADKQADIARRSIEMAQFPKYLRWLARLSGRVVLYVNKVITLPQTAFNRQVVHALKLMNVQLSEINKRIDEVNKKVSALKPWLNAYEIRLDKMLEKSEKKPMDISEGQDQDPLDRQWLPSMDLLYSDYEAVFRGTREEIKKRAAPYLELVQEANAGTESRPILDLGCGRGEWLELLQENNLHAQGLEINQLAIEQGRQRNLTIQKGDALEYLRSAPDEAFGAITGFHIIEHFDTRYFIRLLQQTMRVLKTGGVVIFETPNPKNLIVGACNFWADPTHIRPLFPETQKFLMENIGFANVNLTYHHPHEEPSKLPATEAPQLAASLNKLLSCERDYALTGYKIP